MIVPPRLRAIGQKIPLLFRPQQQVRPTSSSLFLGLSSSSSSNTFPSTITQQGSNNTMEQQQQSAAAASAAARTFAFQIPCPPGTNDEDDYSLYHLQQRTQWLIQYHAALGKICLAIAGGGGHALSTLAATSGASQLLLEGTVTYDKSSYQNYVKRTLPNERGSSFSYSSVDAASMASESALLQGMQLRSRYPFPKGCYALLELRDTVGLGSASTLKTTTQGKMSKTGKPSHGNIVATCADGTQVGMHLILNCPTQNRFQQDVFVSHMILQTLEEVAKMKDAPGDGTRCSFRLESTANRDLIEPTEFNGVTIRQWKKTTPGSSHNNNGSEEEGGVGDIIRQQMDTDDPVIMAAQRILSGEEDAVLLLPARDFLDYDFDDDDVEEGRCNFLEPLRFPVLPDNCLIFPGSFNPPHHGHVGLAKAAIAKTSPSLPENNNGSDKDDDFSHLRPLVFEVSIANADKPSMSPEEVSRRVSQFRTIMKQQQQGNGIPQWGILLTSAPLFSQKIQALRKYAPSPVQVHPKFPLSATEEEGRKHNNRWSFVIGTDTMVRILNPKYYNDDSNQMIESVRSMGVDFVVGGRLEQTTKGSTEFVTGQEALDGLPEDVRDMFILLKESDFRVDVSSTELRAQQQQQQQQKEK